MAEDRSFIVPLERLAKDPYVQVLAYPRSNEAIVESRIRQLKELGISGLEFRGSLRIDRLSVLGKGIVGLVVAGFRGQSKLALKIRRVDSRRTNMTREANMMEAANKAGIGPKYLGSTEDILAMQLLDGQRLPLWLSGLRGRGRKARVRSTFRSLLEQSVRLDAYGLDHGELSRAHKNVIVTPEGVPWILDFESASLMRRVNNFTSLAQYLFLAGGFAKRVARVLGPVDRDDLVGHLRSYKSGMTTDAFRAVLKLLQL